MDTSQEYIDICEKAVEIQRMAPSQYGDFFCSPGFGNSVIGKTYPKRYSTWLPRQDQLQEMVMDKYWSAWALARYFYFFISDIPRPANYSMEQLWLAFVMHEKFGKVWSKEKEDWVNE